jgi:phage terminase Nu1 subunit (DNA packaging protein)
VAEEQRTLTMEQAAREVGLTVRTLSRYRKRGAPCSPGPGRRQLFAADELRAWMRANNLDGSPGTPDEQGPDPDAAPAPPAPTPAAPAPAGQTPRERLLDARARKAMLDVERQELQLAERRGELVLVDDVRRIVQGHFGAVRARLGAWPARVAQRLEGLAYDTRLVALEEELGALLDQLAAVPT